MKLFFVTGNFQLYFVAEACLNILNILIDIIGILTAHRIRIHVHLKICCYFLLSQHILFNLSRYTILGFQLGLFDYDKNNLEDNIFIVLTSWYCVYMYSLVLTVSICVPVDREFSLFYVADYEKRCRPWIPVCNLGFVALSSATMSTIILLEWVNLFLVIFAGVCFAIVGSVMYFLNFRRSWLLNNALKKRKPCRLKYSVSIRYQLEENLWFGETLRNAGLTVSLLVFFTSFFFIFSQLPIYSKHTSHLLMCGFNIIVAADGPAAALGAVLYNTYLIGIIKSLFSKNRVSADKDDGDTYSDQLKRQWDGASLDGDTLESPPLCMVLLFLHE